MTVSVNSLAQPQPIDVAPSYRVGQDGQGHWVAIEGKGLAGGIFRSQEDAIRFACVETGCRPEDVPVAVGPIRLRM